MGEMGKKLLRGSAARLVANFVTLLIGLFLMPIVIRTLGDRHYGIWALSASILGFYGLFDFGISNAVARFVSRALGTEDEGDLLSFFATSFYLLCGLGVIVLLFAGGLAFCGGYLFEDAADVELFKWLALILGASIALRFPTRAFDGVLKSHLRYDLLSGVDIVGAVLRAPLILLVLGSGYGLLGMAVVSAGLELLMETAKVGLAFRVHPGLGVGTSRLSWVRAKIMLGYGSHVLASSVADILRFKISPFVITIFQTVSMVTPFAIAARLAGIMSQLSLALVGVLTPMFSRLEGRGDWARIRSSYLLACRIATYTSVLLGGMMVLLARAFVIRWLGPQYVHVVPLLYVLIAGAVLTCAQIPGMSFLYGTSRHKFYAVSNITHGLLTLAFTCALIGPFGLMGVAVGVAIPCLLVKFFLQPLYACRALRISASRWYFQYVLQDYLVPLGYMLGVALVCGPFVTPSYVGIFLMAIVGCLLFVPYALLVGLSSAQRRQVLGSVSFIPKPLMQVLGGS